MCGQVFQTSANWKRLLFIVVDAIICEQRDGTAMGSPVSVVIANLYMEIFEEQAIESAPYKPKIRKHYVDDTFTILDRDRVDVFLQHLNSQQPSIHFTRDREQQDCLSRHVSLQRT